MAQSEIPIDLDEQGLVPLPKTSEEWRARLRPAEFQVMWKKGTERAFSGAYWDSHTPGIFRCRSCWQPLFDAAAKYESGTGWPSFFEPLSAEAVAEHEDYSLFLGTRVEVVCGRCGAHLGHVFDDGPQPTGLRYCMNSVSLYLEPKPESE